MAAAASFRLQHVVPALAWASALYLLARVGAFYAGIGHTRRHHIESAAVIFLLLVLWLVLRRPATDDAPTRDGSAALRLDVRIVGLAFVAGSLLLYWPLLSTGLFADDYVLLDAARAGRMTVWQELFRPMIFWVWRPLSSATASPGPALHALNVALHGANAALVAVLAASLFERRSSGVAAGLLFLVLPAGVEAIAWPSGLQDVLMTTFVLLFLVLTSSGRHEWWIPPLAATSLIAGLLSKETAVAAPLLAALITMASRSPEVRRRAWIVTAVSFAVVGLYVAVRLALLPLPSGYGESLSRYRLKELVMRPFATLLVPLRDDETRRAPWAAIAAVSLVVVALRLAAGRWHRQAAGLRVTVIGAAMVLAAVGPVLSYFYVDPDLLGSRYLYLAQAGWVLLLVAILQDGSGRRTPVFVPVLLCLVCAAALAGRAHVRMWTDAGRTRDVILAAAGSTPTACESWAVYGLPASVGGVPVFVNGFPEAARSVLPGPIRIAPALLNPGECRLTWNGERFVGE